MIDPFRLARPVIDEQDLWLGRAKSSRALLASWATIASCTAVAQPDSARAAEFGTGPWVKGYTDIFGGILPPVPGFYFRTDAYHYNGDAERTIFNGFAQVGVEEDYTTGDSGAGDVAFTARF